MIVLFWTLAALIAFAALLAVQMRYLLSVALRRALAARFGGEFTDTAYRDAVFHIGRDAPPSPESLHLSAEYPRPLAHLALARRTAIVAPVLLLLLGLAGRFLWKVI